MTATCMGTAWVGRWSAEGGSHVQMPAHYRAIRIPLSDRMPIVSVAQYCEKFDFELESSRSAIEAKLPRPERPGAPDVTVISDNRRGKSTQPRRPFPVVRGHAK